MGIVWLLGQQQHHIFGPVVEQLSVVFDVFKHFQQIIIEQAIMADRVLSNLVVLVQRLKRNVE